MALNEEIAAKVGAFVADPANRVQVETRIGDSEKYAEFLKKFPIESLANLNLENYCLGGGLGVGSFCSWLERGLEKALGRYAPGTSKGHLLYRRKNGSYYQHRKLSDLEPEEAMKYVASITSAIAQAKDITEAVRFDSNDAIYNAAGVPQRVTMGEARRLRVQTIYHPDSFVPINSTDHLEHYLKSFGFHEDEIPDGAAAKMEKLWGVYEKVRDQYNPRLSPRGFASVLYREELGLRPPPRPSNAETEILPVDSDGVDLGVDEAALNQILFGPPGTGKTYEAIALAVGIIDAAEGMAGYPDRAALRKRFDELCRTSRIAVVTFHQSFTYEDFVEGIRAELDEKQGLRYQIEAGIFKQMCLAAMPIDQRNRGVLDDLTGRDIWKMSLGTAGEEDEIYDECIEENYILLGWGGAIDVSGSRNKAEIAARLTKGGKPSDTFAAESLYRFIHGMKERDVVVVSEGNHRFRAIGEITGPYKFLGGSLDRTNYLHSRPVRWLRVYDPARPHDSVFERAFSQQTIHRLTINAEERLRLQALLVTKPDGKPEPYVLIIDEINRGNIARIFGELITLIEADKRQGAREQLTVKLPYSKKPFSVPGNLYLIGTMNTADRSLTSIDHALRRRFEFHEVPPMPDLLRGIQVEGIDIREMLEAMNARIELLFDKDHMLGHAFFMGLRDDPSLDDLAQIFERQVLPLLEEYFFDDLDRVRRVLADDGKPADDQFYVPRFTAVEAASIMGESTPGGALRQAFVLNRTALRSPDAYKRIYSKRDG